MVAWGNSKAVGMAFGNSKAVGGAWGNSKFAFQTVFEWSGACNKYTPRTVTAVSPSRNSATPLPSEWVVGGGNAYLAIDGQPGITGSQVVLTTQGRVLLFLATSPNSLGGSAGPEMTADFERNVRIEFIHARAGTLPIVGTGSDTAEPYIWTPTNSAAVIAWINAVNNGDNVRVRFIL